MRARSKSPAITRLLAALALAFAAVGADAVAQIEFVDRAASGDITLPSANHGLGVLDHDDDGFLDLVMGGNENQTMRLMRNVADTLRPGERTFEEVTAGSGLDDTDGLTRAAFGFAIADYDNDGDPDIYTLGTKASDQSFGLLYRNDGGGSFTNVTVAAGLRGIGSTPESASFHDYDHDGDVDLLVANASGSTRSLLLYENLGNGQFVDASSRTPDLADFSSVYAMVWSDYDSDGWADCFVVVFGNPATLLRNRSDGMGGRELVNVAGTVGFMGLGFAPMGITSGDIDGDGDIDYAVSNGSAGRYFENNGDGTVMSILPFTSIFGWGNALFDAENDGDLDYYMAGSWSTAALDKFFENQGGGSWADESSVLNGVSAPTRFSVQLDFDNDGSIDIIAMNPGDVTSPFSIYENISSTTNHWFKIALDGDGTEVNRDALGAFVRIEAGGVSQVREVNRNGTSTASTEDLRLHFGLGATTVVDRIEVLWPRKGNLGSRLEVFDGPFAADQIVNLSPTPAIALCGAGTVNLDSGSVEDVLLINGSAGDADREVIVADAAPITASMQLPSQGGGGRYVIHANFGAPVHAGRSVLPASIGATCFALLLDQGATPDAIWNNIGRVSRIGVSSYFDGSPLPNPAPAPADFLDLPSGDGVSLPIGTVVTLQGAIRDAGSISPKDASATNAVVLRVQ